MDTILQDGEESHFTQELNKGAFASSDYDLVHFEDDTYVLDQTYLLDAVDRTRQFPQETDVSPWDVDFAANLEPEPLGQTFSELRQPSPNFPPSSSASSKYDIFTPSTSSKPASDSTLLHLSSSSSEPPNSQKLLSPSNKRRPIPRKGHTKSRRGCYNCKRRRIKCNERVPACSHCVKGGFICEYPALPSSVRPQRSSSDEDGTGKSNQDMLVERTDRTGIGINEAEGWVSHGAKRGYEGPTNALNSLPGQFNMQDMRLFHHFIIAAYPHLPVGGDKVWVNVIPAVAWHFPYLLPSLLALSASHLHALTHDSTLLLPAQAHRLHALHALNTSLSSPSRTKVERDARMACSLALTFQAVHLPNAYAEFLTLVRGAFLTGGEVVQGEGEGLRDGVSGFEGFRNSSHVRIMERRLETVGISPCNPALLDDSLSSLHTLRTYCEFDIEKWYCDSLIKIVGWAYDYPSKAYATFASFYSFPGLIPMNQFTHLITPTHAISQCLLAHFLGVQHILIPILIHERSSLEKERVHAPSTMYTWVDDIHSNLQEMDKKREGKGDELTRLISWVQTVLKTPFERLFAGSRIGEAVYKSGGKPYHRMTKESNDQGDEAR